MIIFRGKVSFGFAMLRTGRKATYSAADPPRVQQIKAVLSQYDPFDANTWSDVNMYVPQMQGGTYPSVCVCVTPVARDIFRQSRVSNAGGCRGILQSASNEDTAVFL